MNKLVITNKLFVVGKSSSLSLGLSYGMLVLDDHEGKNVVIEELMNAKIHIIKFNIIHVLSRFNIYQHYYS